MHNIRESVHTFLRKSERYFKIDMVYATTGSFWTGLRFTVSTLVSIASFIAFGNLLPRETYGVYSYLISLAGSLNFFVLSGAGTGVMRAFARGQDNILPYAIRFQLGYNLLATCTIGVVAFYYGYMGNAMFSAALAMLAVAIPLGTVYHTYEFVLMGKKRFDIIAIITSIAAILATLVTIIALTLTQNIVCLIAVFSLTSVVPNLLAHWYVERSLPKTEPDPLAIAELRRTSFHLTGAGLLGSLAQYLDKIVLFQVSGGSALAAYGFALAGPDRLKGLLKNWLSIAQPNLANRSIEDIRKVFYHRVGLSILAGTVISILYITLSPFLFHWFLPKYLDSIVYSRVYALGLIVAPISIYIGLVFNGQNMLRAIYIISTANQFVRIPLFLICGLYWHTWGLVVGSISYYAANAILSIIVWEIESRRLISKKL